LCPIEHWESAWTPEYRDPSQALAILVIKRTAEETQQQWRKCVLKVLPTHSRRDTAESDSHQSEIIVFLHSYYHIQITFSYVVLIPTINHRGEITCNLRILFVNWKSWIDFFSLSSPLGILRLKDLSFR
jgi:hypothetical protein